MHVWFVRVLLHTVCMCLCAFVQTRVHPYVHTASEQLVLHSKRVAQIAQRMGVCSIQVFSCNYASPLNVRVPLG